MFPSAPRPFSRFFGKFFVAALALSLVLGTATAWAARPSTMKLFPEESVIFVRIANANDLGNRVGQTSLGRMFQDPQLKPFVEAFYGKLADFYSAKAEGKVGITWDDLKRLPKGEVAFGVVSRPSKTPALLLLIDQGEEVSVADKLVDKALDFAQEKGGEFSKEHIGDVEVTVVRDKDRENRMFGVCERDNVIILATDPNVIRGVLWHWDHPGELGDEAVPNEAAKESATDNVAADDKKKEGAPERTEEEKKAEAEFVPGRTIAQNTRFATIVQQCRRPQDPPPQVLYYIDPIELARGVFRNKTGPQFVMGLFPSLGVDGLMALGGTGTWATDEYDHIAQFHVLLENPRSGVMLLPAFNAIDPAPQPFVPQRSETYMTWNWTVRTTYDRLIELVETYRPKGSMTKFVDDEVSAKLGIDVHTKIIDNLKGRITWIIGFETPPTLRGQQQHILAFELADEAAAEESFKTVREKYSDVFVEKHFGNVTYYAMEPSSWRKLDEDKRENIPLHPFAAIMDGNFFIGTSTQRFEECIAARDGTAERMVDSADYVRTSAVIGRETTGTTPVLFSLSRPAETMRQWYGALTSEKMRELINEKKEDNEYMAALAEIMDKHQLPPFEVLLPYLAPGGGVLYDTDSGYHGISFSLRNQTPTTEAPAAK
jgi:hypothetical protein